jgi:hypothetical protein
MWCAAIAAVESIGVHALAWALCARVAVDRDADSADIQSHVSRTVLGGRPRTRYVAGWCSRQLGLGSRRLLGFSLRGPSSDLRRVQLGGRGFHRRFDQFQDPRRGGPSLGHHFGQVGGAV